MATPGTKVKINIPGHKNNKMIGVVLPDGVTVVLANGQRVTTLNGTQLVTPTAFAPSPEDIGE